MIHQLRRVTDLQTVVVIISHKEKAITTPPLIARASRYCRSLIFLSLFSGKNSVISVFLLFGWYPDAAHTTIIKIHFTRQSASKVQAQLKEKSYRSEDSAAFLYFFKSFRLYYPVRIIRCSRRSFLFWVPEKLPVLLRIRVRSVRYPHIRLRFPAS